MEVFSYWDYKHPLEHTWTLWYLDNNKTKIWEECLMEVGSFSTVEDFWCLFNHIKPVSTVKPGCDYSLFKKGIRPMWEDKANKDGGRWVINLDKRTTPPQKMDQYWLEIAMCMIGECFFGLNDKICGATISIRNKGNRIGLWTRDTDNENSSIIHIGLKLKELLGFSPAQVLVYQSHKDCQMKNSSSAARNTYYV
ncbi:eukaryotic translation initiation factor 4E1 [Halyomorpha halys]|uniref:eukaryotic translation initiation factor 4E1 n=1 Tax=Halyomorpha halys TaxID=286706 RepID=UPI0006D52352|nr:eukaryotic translation initiation factor 4E [Halyomorpha halys]